MKHEVFICEDYTVENNILIIYKPQLSGMVESISTFNELTTLIEYDAIVCPNLFTDAKGKKINGFIFK